MTFFLSFQAFADNQFVDFKWTCARLDTPLASPQLPASETITYRLVEDRGGYRLVSTEAQAFFQSLPKSNRDYYPCISEFGSDYELKEMCRSVVNPRRCRPSDLIASVRDGLLAASERQGSPLLPAELLDDGPLTPDQISAEPATRVLDMIQENDCEYIGTYSIVYLAHSEVHMEATMASSAACRANILINLGTKLSETQTPPGCELEEIQGHPICEDWERRVRPYFQSFDRLAASLHPNNPHSRKQCIERIPNMINEVAQLRNQFNCRPLRPGENRIAIPEPNQTGIINSFFDEKFTLRRREDGVYQAEIPISFMPSEGSTVSVEEMQTRATECVRRANRGLMGPNRQRLELSLQFSDDPFSPGAKQSSIEAALRQPRNRISIERPPKRSNARQWEETVDCAVILHELLHLLGLIDEYSEGLRGVVRDAETGSAVEVDNRFQHPGAVEAYDCRAVGSPNSIMANHSVRWNEVFGNLGHLNSADSEPKISLIDPAHFNMITYPGCRTKNSRYIECASYSGITSALEPDRCAAKPPYCDDGSWLQ